MALGLTQPLTEMSKPFCISSIPYKHYYFVWEETQVFQLLYFKTIFQPDFLSTRGQYPLDVRNNVYLHV